MNIMYAIGNVTGKTTKLIWGATTTTTGSAVRGFKDAFKSPTIITPNDDLEPVTSDDKFKQQLQADTNLINQCKERIFGSRRPVQTEMDK